MKRRKFESCFSTDERKTPKLKSFLITVVYLKSIFTIERLSVYYRKNILETDTEIL